MPGLAYRLTLALVLVLAAAGSVLAHAILVESTPAIGTKIEPGLVQLRLRYNSRIDRSRSRLTLIHPDRSTETVPIMDAGNVDMLIGAVSLPPGRYTLRWQVLAVDGHITRGDVPFAVRDPAGSD